MGLRIAGELEPARGNETVGGEMLYRRSADGHFYIDATVNGSRSASWWIPGRAISC